jgi:hypothetical protein
MSRARILAALLVLVCACGRYGPPVRNLGSAAPVSQEAASEPNAPCPPESVP